MTHIHILIVGNKVDETTIRNIASGLYSSRMIEYIESFPNLWLIFKVKKKFK